jgi:hypothetical protein
MSIRSIGTQGVVQQPGSTPLLKAGNTDPRFEQYRIQAAQKSSVPAQEEADQATITSEEREYFGTLFPEAASDLKTYSTYSPSGLRSAAVAGTMIDRKA